MKKLDSLLSGKKEFAGRGRGLAGSKRGAGGKMRRKERSTGGLRRGEPNIPSQGLMGQSPGQKPQL